MECSDKNMLYGITFEFFLFNKLCVLHMNETKKVKNTFHKVLRFNGSLNS